MPIKSLHLKNFQSHKQTNIIDIHPGINVIIGKSDSGKSSIIRALGALIYRFSFYFRNGENEGEVQINCGDERPYICRTVKTKGFHCSDCKKPSETMKCEYCGQILSAKVTSDVYQINHEEFSKFGAKIPENIANLIGFKPVMFGDHEELLNIRTQHQDMFFIGESYTGGARNKILSSLIVDSDKIDSVIKKFNNEIQRDKVLIEEYERLINEAEEKIEIQKDIIACISETKDAIEKNQGHRIKQGDRLNQLSRFQNELQRFEIFKTLKDKTSLLGPFIDKLNLKIKTLQETINKFAFLDKLKLIKITFEDLSKNIISNLQKNIALVEAHLRQVATYQKIDYQFSDNRSELRQKKTQGESLGSEIAKCRTEIERYFSGKAICPITKLEYCQSCKTTLKDKCIKGE